MEAWSARLAATQEALMEHDEEGKLEMQMALDQLQAFIDLEPKPKRTADGSSLGKSPNIEKLREVMNNHMYIDYSANPSIWGPSFFRCRYCMRRSMFNMILKKMCSRDSYFVEQRDTCGLIGLSS